MKTNLLPNFLIVGVARCGTTSLFHYLKQHPQIGFPKEKEPKYFSAKQLHFPQNGIGDATVDAKMVKTWEAYQRLFADLGDYRRRGDASSDYFYYHQHTIAEIKKSLGDVPVLISIREPVERSYSAFNNLVRDGRETLSFEQALKAEESRKNAGWDWMWAYKSGSRYAEGIAAFQENFSQVKVVLFDELKRNPKALLEEIEAFLGLDPYGEYDTSTKYSPSGSPKNGMIKLISSRNSKITNALRTLAMHLLPRTLLEKIAKGFFAKEELPKETKEYLKNYFAEDIQKTGELLDNSLNAWKK